MSLVPARIIVVMGVASSGKTVTGAALALRLKAPFLDGDDFHPITNKERMRAGIPLRDQDRWPWLAAVALGLRDAAFRDGLVIGACSALRRAYRHRLIAEAGEPILFAYLEGSRQLLEGRISSRTHEYMPASLLDSQFAALEPPGPEENAVTVPVIMPVEAVVDRLLAFLPDRSERQPTVLVADGRT